MQQINTLSQADVLKIINAIGQEFSSKNLKAAAAICDAHGELLGFIRSDACPLPSITIAMNKAFTASRAQEPSKNIGDRTGQPRFHMTNYGDPRFTAWGGGVPIMYKGECVGAVAVSGLTEDEDIALASMGAAARNSGPNDSAQLGEGRGFGPVPRQHPAGGSRRCRHRVPGRIWHRRHGGSGQAH